VGALEGGALTTLQARVRGLKYERGELLEVLPFLFSRPVLYVTVGGQDEIEKALDAFADRSA
jgi:hypothetical protein